MGNTETQAIFWGPRLHPHPTVLRLEVKAVTLRETLFLLHGATESSGSTSRQLDVGPSPQHITPLGPSKLGCRSRGPLRSPTA